MKDRKNQLKPEVLSKTPKKEWKIKPSWLERFFSAGNSWPAREYSGPLVQDAIPNWVRRG